MWCQGAKHQKTKKSFSLHQHDSKGEKKTTRTKLCCRSTTHAFVVAVAVGGCSVWRWNGGWVSVRSHRSVTYVQEEHEHLPQDVCVCVHVCESSSISVSGGLSGGCGGSLTAAADLIHERSIRFSLNGRVMLVCWRLSWQLPLISTESPAQWSCKGVFFLLPPFSFSLSWSNYSLVL